MKLRELIGKIPYRLAAGGDLDHREADIARVVTRAEEAASDTLYLCLRTAVRDGALGAMRAYENGCRLFVSERGLLLPKNAAVLVVDSTAALAGALAAKLLGYPARRLTVLGITGSAGKTSVADTVTTILHRAGRRVASITTDGVRIGEKLRPRADILPDATDLQALLHELAQADVEIAVLELSSYTLTQGWAFSIPFTAVLLTNLLADHADGTVTAYTDTLASLFDGDAAFQIFPANFVGFEPRGAGRRLTFGADGDAYAEAPAPYETELEMGTRFSLCLDGERARVSLPVVGDFAIENALAAALLLRCVGMPAAQIAAGLSAYAPKGRMECIARRMGRAVYRDSAYDARDLTRVLTVLRERTAGRLSVLLGSVGERDRVRRRSLGYAATAYADMAYFTADDPGCESARQIAEEMAAGATSSDRYVILPDRLSAIRRAARDLRAGDVLLLAGKGGQDYQVIGDRRVPFFEKEAVSEAFEE